MNTRIVFLFLPVLGVVLGSIIGLFFGFLQTAALERHKSMQQAGTLRNAMPLVPGSMRRVAMLLLCLVAVQVALPMLFERDGIQWVVSIGVVLGYGVALFKQASRGSHRA